LTPSYQQFATDFVGLSQMDLRRYMGAIYDPPEENNDPTKGEANPPMDSLGISASAREALLPPGPAL
jgi:hypothetical protein